MDDEHILPRFDGAIESIAARLAAGHDVHVKITAQPEVRAHIVGELLRTPHAVMFPIMCVAKDPLEQSIIFSHLTGLKKQKNTQHIPIFTNSKPLALYTIMAQKPCALLLCESTIHEPVVSAELFAKHILTLKPKQRLNKEAVLTALINAGYTIERTAALPGCTASRGSIVDVFPPHLEHAIRIDFFDDAIDALYAIAPKGGTATKITRAEIIPYALTHCAHNATLADYGNCPRLMLESFPARADVVVSLSNTEIRLIKELYAPKNTAQKKPKQSLSFLKKLSVGDPVVHLDHGVALFAGMTEQALGGIEREYFKLEYAEGDMLFLPVTMAEKIERYIGDVRPTLNRLSGTSWQKTMQKVSLDTLKQARELLNTQAMRNLVQAVDIPRVKIMEESLSKTFQFTLTPDQKSIIDAIYDDLSKPVPMDRLVCGDVGFGKTEVAIRAAAMVAHAGFQVAVLSPTTILSQQHADTFAERLQDFPFRIAQLSRFQSPKEQEKTIAELARGTMDIVIGTHRLFSSDVRFSNLGLIIIDEEQRFGVTHKEQLKKMRAQAHVLTLTATPIPRTMHLGLSGIREISSITTPPAGRKSIITKIEPYNQKHIKAALEFELERNGQAYYLYNNVETMDLKLKELAEFLPKVRFGMLHGQLPEAAIAGVMHKFDNREIDVLVCSTIIENGLDLPNVNTLIVDNAVQFGLSQLHQIRGRIGRASRQAYAYFFYKRHKLTGEAEKRLEALESAHALGSGFELARRDMEIRGVGNVLGRAQHGHVKSVGLGLYLRLLHTAVEDIKAGTVHDVIPDITVDVPLEARIPQFFEQSKEKRIELYHEWALYDSLDDIAHAKNELEKEGRLPQTVDNLFYILRLKILGRRAGITAIDTGFVSNNSQEQLFILKTEKPIEPKLFSTMLDVCPQWVYASAELKVKKADLGTGWTKKLEESIKKLVV